MSTVTSREFNRDVSAVKRHASQGPVIITDHGRPSHVLLTFDDYRRLVDDGPSLGDAFVVDDDLEFDVGRPSGTIR